MKTIVSLIRTQVINVLVENANDVSAGVIEDAVMDAYSRGAVFIDENFEDEEFGTQVLSILHTESTDSQKQDFANDVSCYVLACNKFTLDELLEEDE